MTDALPRRNRWEPEELRAHLDRLDRAGAGYRGAELRAAPRHRYRPRRLAVEVLDGDQRVAGRFAAVGRNLSRQGLAFLVERLIYPGTACRVRLRGPHRHEQVVGGRVVRCRYVLGSGQLHDVGVRFERWIDLAAFVPRARLVRVLLADADPGLPALLAGLLRGLNVELTAGVPRPAEVVSAALAGSHDLVLLDLEDARVDALAVTAELRRQGFVGPVVGLAVQVGETLYQRCLEAGCTGYLRKPLMRQAVRGLVRSLMDKPLVSTLAHRPELAPLIDQFVGGLPACTRQLAHALRCGDLAGVDRIARRLRGAGGSYGFGAITEAAADVQAAVADPADPARLHDEVSRLIHLCLTARPVACVEPVP